MQSRPSVDGGTILEVFRTRVDEIGGRPALRHRGPEAWETLTWADYGDAVDRVAAGLLHLGLGPSTQVGIFSNNRIEWHLADLGSLAIGGVVVPLYQTSSAEQVAYLLGHSEARVCFVENGELLDRVLEARADLPKLDHIVVFDEAAEDTGPGVLAIGELMALGAKELEQDRELVARSMGSVAADHVATIVYTSGTTGPPKGAVVTHGNIMAVLRSAIPFVGMQRGERFLSFLPLSHVAERMISDFAAIAVGGETWFARSLATLAEDLRACQPTVFFAVPRVWEKLQQAVLDQVQDGPYLQRVALRSFLSLGRRVASTRQIGASVPLWEAWPHHLLNRVVGGRLRSELGLEAAHLIASSAAPVDPHLLLWLHGAGLPVFEIYGQTEVCGPATCNPPQRNRIGTVGIAMPGMEVTTAADGEVLVRGGNVCLGYLNDERATADLVDSEGWLHTGDLGRADRDGYLRIIGRKKDIIITSGGQNISPEGIEDDLRSHPLVATAIVVGEGRRYLTALLFLDEPALTSWAAARGQDGRPEDLVAHPKLEEEIERLVSDVNERHARVENIRRYRLLTQPLTVESGELTPTYKVKRRVIEERNRQLIEDMYDEEPARAG